MCNLCLELHGVLDGAQAHPGVSRQEEIRVRDLRQEFCQLGQAEATCHHVSHAIVVFTDSDNVYILCTGTLTSRSLRVLTAASSSSGKTNLESTYSGCTLHLEEARYKANAARKAHRTPKGILVVILSQWSPTPRKARRRSKAGSCPRSPPRTTTGSSTSATSACWVSSAGGCWSTTWPRDTPGCPPPPCRNSTCPY